MPQGFKRAFYPCCASDIRTPRIILRGVVDEIVFCDLKKPANWEVERGKTITPRIRYLQEDVATALQTLPPINVFFYRNDSPGEGGSGLYLLSRKWLERIVQCFDPFGGLIITDKSNSSGRFIRKVERPGGYTRKSWGWHFSMPTGQPFLETHGLTTYRLDRIGK